MRVLSRFLDLIFPPRETEMLVRTATPAMLGPLLRPALVERGMVALAPYRAPLMKALAVEAKFRDGEAAQKLLGGMLADYLLAWDAERRVLDPSPASLVPVPLSAARLRERGYNQAERICRAAARSLPDIALETDLLARVRDTAPQTTLGGALRRENMLGAFRAVQPPDPDHTYIVVDDVMTTGATLSAAVSALRDAGATRVIGLALTY